MSEVRFTDYFQLLGVNTDATKDDIKKAFMAKALVYHPDKANDEAERTKLTALYQDLQDAYRILSSDKARQQYVDARQTTFLDFKREERDTGYGQSNLFKTVDENGCVVFDKDAFSKSFVRDDSDSFQKLQKQFTDAGKLQESNIKSFMDRRAEEDAHIRDEVSNLNLGRGKEFDRNAFNRMFDEMKAKQPGSGMQPYEGCPVGYFSSGGLVEDDRFGGLSMNNGLGFNTGMDSTALVGGYLFNPSEYNVDSYKGLPEYGMETKLSAQEIADKLASHMDDRLKLGTLKKEDFVVTPSEIEVAYGELFKEKEVEGLEAPVMLKK